MALGVLSALVAVAIWAGWLVLLRATSADLAPLDVALLRYGAPAVLLAPVWLRSGVLPAGVARWRVAVMALGWGAPFALLCAQGAKAGGVALFAAMTPGTMPLWLALISAALIGARPDRPALAGLALMAGGAVLALRAAPPATLAGAPWFVAAALGWASYAVAFRGAGLTPLQATAITAFWSSLGLAPLTLLLETRLPALDWPARLEMLALHGVVSGVVSVLAFAIAIQRLGALKAGAFAALVPVTAGLGGWAVLGEAPTPPALAALVCASIGAGLVSGVRPWPARR